jgi:uncharacterized membrane protein
VNEVSQDQMADRIAAAARLAENGSDLSELRRRLNRTRTLTMLSVLRGVTA